MTRVTFTDPEQVYNFGVGDFIGDNGIVTAVDRDGSITCARATWWRRARYGARYRIKHVWWWLRCSWADLWTEGEE